MSGKHAFLILLLGVPFLNSIGCRMSDDEVYDGPAISLSSLKEAEKQLAEKTEQLDQADRMSLPLVVDDAEWDLQPCLPTPRTQAVMLSGAIPAKVDIWGLAVSPESGKALVTFRDLTEDRRGKTTAGAYCDVINGEVLSTFDLPDYAAPYSLHPTGSYAILSRADGYLSERHTLYIAELNADQVTLRQWRPLVDPLVEQPKSYIKKEFIRWASFVGEDRVVTVNDEKTLHVWSFPELDRLGSFTGVDGIPSLSPDQQRVVFAAGDTLALLDPSVPAIVGHRRFGSPPEKPIVAVHPDGDRVAIGGKGQAMIIDLVENGYFRVSNRLNTSMGSRLVPDFAFIGPYLHHMRSLYDFASPQAVWSISRNQCDLPVGDSYWSVVWHRTKGAPFGSKQLALRSFKIPHEEIQQRIADVHETSEVLALQTGDSVRVDVSGIPAARRSEIRDALISKLAKKGFFPADSAQVTVKAFLDPEKEFKSTYIDTKGSPITPWTTEGIPEDEIYRVTYRGRMARLWIVKDGRKLWTREGMEHPPSRLGYDDMPDDGRLHFYGEPKYSVFTDPNLPDYLAGDYSGALGKTSLGIDGVKSWTNRPRRRKK